MVYADLLRPRNRAASWVYDAGLVFAGSLLVVLSARFEIRLAYSPVPITGQTLAVVMLGALLGSRRGAACLLAYLLEGLAGFPVFSGGGAGLAHMLGPTGGYLVGFVAAAWLTGALAEHGWDRRLERAFVAMAAGNLAIYFLGLPWLAAYVGLSRALALGFTPFIPGDLLKLGVATLLLPSGWALVGQWEARSLDGADL